MYTQGCEQFQLLDCFLRKLKELDPRTNFEVNWRIDQRNHERFESLFITPGPLSDKIGNVMPVFSCDGATLPNPQINGCLLLLTGMDAERRLVPFAIGIVKSESKETWSWFLVKCVESYEALKLLPGVLISDRDKGLNAVNVKEIMSNIEHVYCCNISREI